MSIVFRNTPRIAASVVAGFAQFGAATDTNGRSTQISKTLVFPISANARNPAVKRRLSPGKKNPISKPDSANKIANSPM